MICSSGRVRRAAVVGRVAERASSVCRMRHVVVDEADLLLTGGFQRDVRRILDALREGDRAQRTSAVGQKLGLTPDALAALPRHLRRAAAEGTPQSPLSFLHSPTLANTGGYNFLFAWSNFESEWDRELELEGFPH